MQQKLLCCFWFTMISIQRMNWALLTCWSKPPTLFRSWYRRRLSLQLLFLIGFGFANAFPPHLSIIAALCSTPFCLSLLQVVTWLKRLAVRQGGVFWAACALPLLTI